MRKGEGRNEGGRETAWAERRGRGRKEKGKERK